MPLELGYPIKLVSGGLRYSLWDNLWTQLCRTDVWKAVWSDVYSDLKRSLGDGFQFQLRDHLEGGRL